MGHQMLQLHFFPTDTRCHGNEIWDKIGYNSVFVIDICEIFASKGGFWGWASECCQSSFSPTDPRCNGNEILDKTGYNSTYVRAISEIMYNVLCQSSHWLPYTIKRGFESGANK